MRNKMAVPSQLERVTNQWQPVRAGGTAKTRVTDECSKFKDRNGRRCLETEDLSENQIARAMAGPARISSRKPRCGCADGNRGNLVEGGNTQRDWRTLGGKPRDVGRVIQ